jgi:hypothetical protein
VLRLLLVPLTYVVGALLCIAIASALPPSDRASLFADLYLVIALLAPIYATIGRRCHAQVGWMLAWIALPAITWILYVVFGDRPAMFLR